MNTRKCEDLKSDIGCFAALTKRVAWRARARKCKNHLQVVIITSPLASSLRMAVEDITLQRAPWRYYDALTVAPVTTWAARWSDAFLECLRCLRSAAAMPIVPVRLTIRMPRLVPGAAPGHELDHIIRDRRNDVKHSYWSADGDAPPASC